MSLLNPTYLQASAASTGQMKKKKRGQAQGQMQTNPMAMNNMMMMQVPGYQNYANMDPSMYMDPSTMYAMAQSGMFNINPAMNQGMMAAQPPPPPPLINPPLPTSGNKTDYTKNVNLAGKEYKKRSRNDSDKPPAKRVKPEDRVTVFVGGLHPDSDEDSIWDFFDEKGIALTSVRKKDGKMFGHIDLVNPGDLHKVLAINGEMFMGFPVRLEKSSVAPPAVTTEGKDTKTLFVANLSDSVTEQTLREFFPDSLEVRYPVDKSGTHVGYAFIKYGDEAKVKSLIDEFQGVSLEGNSMILDYAAGKNPTAHKGPSDGDKDPNSLFVGNITKTATKEVISKLFPKCCEVRFPNGEGKSNFCFIKFEDPKDARETFNDKEKIQLDGKNLIIDYAVSKQGRKKNDDTFS
ncbi:nucleolin isoform X2 [Patella vulgata]|uniref:nucleolin isoform X2 n=1 Tax=Patella vulgata TaxID=6465 RepID=UPI00217FBFC7|nr:nucleolin isoform X2 [Patella vulgata]